MIRGAVASGVHNRPVLETSAGTQRQVGADPQGAELFASRVLGHLHPRG